MVESNRFRTTRVMPYTADELAIWRELENPPDAEDILALRFLATIDKLSNELREWRTAAMTHGAEVHELNELLTKYGIVGES